VSETQIVWIDQLREGNELAAFNIYKSYADAMYNTLLRLTNDAEVAKDLLQESFIKAFGKIEDLDEPRAFGGWLKRIVVNIGLEYVRKKKYDFKDIEDIEDIHDEEIIEDQIENEAIHQAIKSLPEGCRTVLSLHLFEGLKHKEIAEQLNITESTSKTQFRHAKKLLKKKLEAVYEN